MKSFNVRKRNRLIGYDYSQNGYYFVTICTHNRVNWFGEIIDKQLFINNLGTIVQEQLHWLARHYFYVKLDQYVVMPNHIHAVLIIEERNGRDRSLQDSTKLVKIKPLSSLVGAFKTTSSKKINQFSSKRFNWQKSFHDRIVRNDEDLTRIREYIINNPKNWKQDQDNLDKV